MSLSRIEVITGMSKFSSLKAALSKAGVRGMTVMQVLGCGVENFIDQRDKKLWHLLCNCPEHIIKNSAVFCRVFCVGIW